MKAIDRLREGGLAMLGVGLAGVVVWAAFTATGVALVVHGVEPARAYATGTPGTFTASSCTYRTKGGERGWYCTGSFAADDGATTGDVDLRPSLVEEPAGPLPARVTGPDPSTAWRPGPGLLMPGGAGLFMLGLCPVMWGLMQRRERAAARAAWAAEPTADERTAEIRRDIAELRRLFDKGRAE